jgi:predicted nuclease with TOPRIM domain
LIDADEKSLELSDLVTFARDVDRAGSNLFERKAILEQIQTRIAHHEVVQMYMGDRFCADAGLGGRSTITDRAKFGCCSE